MTAYDGDSRFAQVFAARSRSLDASLADQAETREREKEALDEALNGTRPKSVEAGTPAPRPHHHHPDRLRGHGLQAPQVRVERGFFGSSGPAHRREHERDEGRYR